MVTGLLKPDHGSITVMGIDALADAVRAKQFMAWLSDEPMIYDKLTSMEYLEFVAGLWAVENNLAEARACELIAAGRLLAEENLDDLRRQAGSGHASLEDTFLALLETGSAEEIVAA